MADKSAHAAGRVKLRRAAGCILKKRSVSSVQSSARVGTFVFPKQDTLTYPEAMADWRRFPDRQSRSGCSPSCGSGDRRSATPGL